MSISSTTLRFETKAHRAAEAEGFLLLHFFRQAANLNKDQEFKAPHGDNDGSVDGGIEGQSAVELPPDGSYQRLNGRYEGRFRPQCTLKLPHDNTCTNATAGILTFTCVSKSYKGFRDGLHRYEFLEYFDTIEEKAAWLHNVKRGFARLKKSTLKEEETNHDDRDSTKIKNTFEQLMKPRRRCFTSIKRRWRHAPQNGGSEPEVKRARSSLNEQAAHKSTQF